jgi:hypothetical protein
MMISELLNYVERFLRVEKAEVEKKQSRRRSYACMHA